MSEYRCGSCGAKYTFAEYRNLESRAMDLDDPSQGNESVCEMCGAGMHTDRWRQRETITTPNDTEIDVSTVALLLGHGRNHDQWFETCLFYDGGSRIVERYRTKEKAKDGHKRYVEAIINGKYHRETTATGIVVDID